MPTIESAQQPVFHHSTDTSGLLCPEPIMMLHRMMRQAQANETVHLIATDPSTLRDIPKFCTFFGPRISPSTGRWRGVAVLDSQGLTSAELPKLSRETIADMVVGYTH